MALTSKPLNKVRDDVPVSNVTKGVIRGKKQIITIGFSPELLAKIDDAAERNGISRAAFINLSCSKAVTSE